MLKSIRRTIAILLVISLVYANISGTIFGVISYAIDDGQEVDNKENTNAPISVEEDVKKALEIEVSEFYKNNMQEQQTEYEEKLNIEIDDEKEFKEIVISDIASNIIDEVVEESDEEVEEDSNEEEQKEVLENSETTVEKEINIFYKNTQINKEELIKAIGENGSLEIICESIEIPEEQKDKEEIDEQDEIDDEKIIEEETMADETEEVVEKETPADETEEVVEKETPADETEEIAEEDNTESENLDEEKIEVGIINIENDSVIINSETEANDEGIITIIYPENVNSIEIKVLTDADKIEKLEIVNTRIIDIVEDINKANVLQTTKQIVVKDEEEILNEQETIDTAINYTSTKAELGIDKAELSNIVDNKVNFTITMLTNDLQYDLYKNPYFIIELPDFIESVNVDNILILNNPCFEIKQIEQATLQNENKVIVVTLEGEQLEYTKSNEENVQIVIEATLVSNELLPTIDTEILLHYYNEKAKTYDGIGNQVIGDTIANVTFVSDKEVIVETKATVEEKTVTSFKEDYNSIVIEPNTYNTATIAGTVVNNIGENISNAIILGTTNAMGPITGVENVYYTANENATVDINDVNNGWTSEYTQSAKKYLIIIENFEQAQTLKFNYTMYMPEKVEDDTEYQEKYEIYNSNNEVIETSQITIYQEAERFDYYEDEMIRANIQLDTTEALKLGETLKAKINVINISEQILENATLDVSLPAVLLDEIYFQVFVDGEPIEANISREGTKFKVNRLNIEKGSNIMVEIKAGIGEYLQPTEQIKVDIKSEQLEAKISDKIKIIKPSQIETTITSDKLGQVLEANESIQYKVVLRNNGKSNADIEVKLPEGNNVKIQKMESINLSTEKKNSISGVDLTGVTQILSINSGETVEIYINAIAKELEKNTAQTMYVDITGRSIYDTTTDRLVNKINKKVEEVEEAETEEKTELVATQDVSNSIKGTAWIDKNQNGQRDKNEVLLKGVQAVLINTENAEEVTKQPTDNNGEYSFNNIPAGNYIVEFRYNTNTFSVTEYKNQGVSEDLDSDIISTTQNNQTTAKTEVITVSQGITEEANAGFVINKKFDMSINKGITKVTVDNEQGTNTYEFGNTNMAKVEIDGKYLKGSLILVEYQITVTNVGEIAGYVKTISDKIPEGMKFNSELNPEWYQENNEELYSNSLADKELQPGETATITLTLTKEMTDDKILAPVNKVAIQEAFNNHLVKDISTENDESEATIIISLTTGKTPSYMWLVITVIAIIGLGAFGVIKTTNKNFEENVIKERRK